MLIKMLLRGTFPICHFRESGNPSSPSLREVKRRSSNLNGFTMIELMVAVAILAMVILGILQAYSVGFMGMADARDRTVATNFAREAMENVKNMDFELITNDNLSTPETFEGKFNRLVTVVVENDDLKKVTTTVSWDDRNGIPKYEVILETLIYNKDL